MRTKRSFLAFLFVTALVKTPRSWDIWEADDFGTLNDFFGDWRRVARQPYRNRHRHRHTNRQAPTFQPPVSHSGHRQKHQATETIQFSVGDRVEGFWPEYGNKWYAGKITSVNGDATYGVHWDDNTTSNRFRLFGRGSTTRFLRFPAMSARKGQRVQVWKNFVQQYTDGRPVEFVAGTTGRILQVTRRSSGVLAQIHFEAPGMGDWWVHAVNFQNIRDLTSERPKNNNLARTKTSGGALRFKEGGLIEVSQDFVSDDNTNTRLRRGLRGKIVEVDADGDLRIKFNGMRQMKWVLKKNFGNIKPVVQRQSPTISKPKDARATPSEDKKDTKLTPPKVARPGKPGKSTVDHKRNALKRIQQLNKVFKDFQQTLKRDRKVVTEPKKECGPNEIVHRTKDGAVHCRSDPKHEATQLVPVPKEQEVKPNPLEDPTENPTDNTDSVHDNPTLPEHQDQAAETTDDPSDTPPTDTKQSDTKENPADEDTNPIVYSKDFKGRSEQKIQVISDHAGVSGVYVLNPNTKFDLVLTGRDFWFQQQEMANGKRGHVLVFNDDMGEWAVKKACDDETGCEDDEIVSTIPNKAVHPADISGEWEGANVVIRRSHRTQDLRERVVALTEQPRALQVYSFESGLRALLKQLPTKHRGRPIFVDESKKLRLHWSGTHNKWVMINKDRKEIVMYSEDLGSEDGPYAAHPAAVTKWSREVIVALVEVGDEVSTTKPIEVDATISQVKRSRNGRTCYMVKFDWLPADLADRSIVRVCDHQGVKPVLTKGAVRKVGDRVSFKREYELTGSIDEIHPDTYVVKLRDDALTNGPLAGDTIDLRKSDAFVTDL